MRRVFIRVTSACVVCLIATVCATCGLAEAPTIYSVGVARCDITPTEPLLLTDAGFSGAPSSGSPAAISARALAISASDGRDPVVLITVDSRGVPASVGQALSFRLMRKVGLSRSRLAIHATNAYSTPWLLGSDSAAMAALISDSQRKSLDNYAAELTDKLENLAVDALSDQQPSRMSWGVGAVSSANPRRINGGTTDPDFPVLVVKSLEGKVRALYASGAFADSTSLSGRVDGNWATHASRALESDLPGSTVLVAVGCSGGPELSTSPQDTNPQTERNATEIVREIKRLMDGFLAPVVGPITVSWTPVSFDLTALPKRSEWEARSGTNDARGLHARLQMARLSLREPLPTQVSAPVQSWSFGKSLAMVFLPGEVSPEIGVRLKKELDGQRVWVNSCANDVSFRLFPDRSLASGKLDQAAELPGFTLPTSLAAGAEAKVIAAARKPLHANFAAPYDANKTSGSMPKSPQQSLTTMQTTENLRVDLVVAEPLIADPVAIDFGLGGELWVAEMSDYPTGMPGPKGEVKNRPEREGFIPGGRVRLVRDSDGDGQFDSSTVFLDKIQLPTGITVWKKGVLVCTAPDILYAEDTNGDDKADIVTKLYSGFGALNIQARVNSLCYGIDGWIYGSCGFAGGTITNFKGEKFELGNRDFRIKPDTGEIEPAAGRTQQGRPRDDFGNWFGCDNLNMAFHYPLQEQYLKRNPHIVYPANRVNLTQTDESRRLFPARADAQRFQLSGVPGTVTAACGLGVYRDNKLGPEYTNNLMVCEPVNLLVHRMVLKPEGSSFVAERAANEGQEEFLRSNDSWFRPVQAVTGPDGAMWIVDMYRFIIENPRWIPENELAGLDFRAGATMGRIYRVRNASETVSPSVKYAGTPSGDQGQLLKFSPVFRELEFAKLAEGQKGSDSTSKPNAVRSFTKLPDNPIDRFNYYRLLEASGELSQPEISQAIGDTDPHVRAFGLQLAERVWSKTELPSAIANATRDTDAHVRLQAACSIGEWQTPEAGVLLAEMAIKNADDPFLVAAVYSGVTSRNLSQFAEGLFQQLGSNEPPESLMPPFLATAVGYQDNAAIKRALTVVAPADDAVPKVWQLKAITNLLESLAKRPKDQQTDSSVLEVIQRMQNRARELAVTDSLDEKVRIAAIALLGRDPAQKAVDTEKLTQLLTSSRSPAIQVAAVESIERVGTDEIPAILAERFRELSPSIHPRVVDVFLDHNNWIPLLFDGIDAGTIPVAAMTAPQRQEVLGHHIPSVRERSAKVLAASINSNRKQVIQEYQPALELVGDAERGRAAFTKTCAQCHRLGDLGHAVGPNLAMVSGKPPAYLLQELLDPNRNVEARFTSYIAVTKDGLTRTGILTNESSTAITLLGPEAKEFPLQRQEIEEIRTSGKSLMPEGLEKDLSVQNVADLIAFLCSAPAVAKHFEGNHPEAVKVASGPIDLPASKATIVGDQIGFDKSSGSVVNWKAVQDNVSWAVELSEPTEFDVYLDYACDSSSAGNGFVVDAGTASLSGYLKSTGGKDQYKTVPVGRILLAAKTQKIVLRPDGGAMTGSLANVRGLRLVRSGEKLGK